jgi:hypothetical protein
MVELDQVLGYTASLALVRLEDIGFSDTLDNEGDLPAQVIRVLHGDVHALACFGRVSVDGVAGEEDAFVGVESGADSLSNL